MEEIDKRATLKDFGILANDAFYKGREDLFPTKFYGYHAGQDLESFSNEKTDSTLIPFYAVADGTIIYAGKLSGYGGVILEKLSDNNHVALYGHVKISTSIEVGSKVSAGQLISYLGNNFSSETSGERKHLHFAIHKGTNLYFHGHEESLNILKDKWEDPILFLGDNRAISPGQKTVPTPTTGARVNLKQPSLPKPNIFQFFVSIFSYIFRR